MKFRPKTDARKNFAITAAMHKQSAAVRRDVMKSAGVVMPRSDTVGTDKPTTRIKLNLKGNRRGMHMQENPPSSEEMRRRRAMRRLWNKQMPNLACSNCQFSSQCPQFRAGYECAFLPFLNSHQIESEEDLLFYAKELCGENVKRAQVMLIMEKLSGAKPDIDTTESLSHVFGQLMQLHQRLTDGDSGSLEIESTDGTIIGRLFGGLDQLLNKTKTAQIELPTHAGELTLDAESGPSLLPEGAKLNADQELVGELALLKSVPVPSSVPKQMSVKGPTQEEL